MIKTGGICNRNREKLGEKYHHSVSGNQVTVLLK